MKRNILFIFLFIMSIAAVHAQEKKSYTLEDVIPGGNNYANLRPKILQDSSGGAMYAYALMWKPSMR